ncbi:MAG: hypothetical protein AAF515_12350 [Pseudomonadota bacterium]
MSQQRSEIGFSVLGRGFLRVAGPLCLALAVGGAPAALAAGDVIVAEAGATPTISVRDALTLAESSSFTLTGSAAIESVAVDNTDALLVTAGDTLSRVGLDGVVLDSVTVAGASFIDAQLLAGTIYALSAGATPGISVRNPDTLAETDFIDIAVTPVALQVGFGRLYLVSADELQLLQVNGDLVTSISAPAGVSFVDATLTGTRLYLAENGATNRISARSPNTLNEFVGFAVASAIDGIGAGGDVDLYVSVGGELLRLDTDGGELARLATPAAADVAFVLDPRALAVGDTLALFNGVASSRDAESLVEGSAPLVGKDARALSVTSAGSLVVVEAGRIRLLDADGVELANLAAGAGLTFVDATADAGAAGDQIAVATGGTQDGVLYVDEASLAEGDSFNTAFAPERVAVGDDGDLYFSAGSAVFRFSAAGVELASLSSAGRTYTGVTFVKNVVYASYGAGGEVGIAVLDPDTLVQADVIDTPFAPLAITAGGANDYYIAGSERIAHLALDEVVGDVAVADAEFSDVAFGQLGAGTPATTIVAATLPDSRSVEVGAVATAFATIINSGDSVARACGVAPRTAVSGSFDYQTTDGTTNMLTGTANTPVDIPAGASQAFVIAYQPDAAFASAEAALSYSCANAPATDVIDGVNTLLLVVEPNPVADLIAVALTASGDGIVEVSLEEQISGFGIATFNQGESAEFTVRASVTDGDERIELSLCATNSETAACINPEEPSDTVTLTIANEETPTFSVFVAVTGAIELDAATKRIRVTFEEGGVVRGATSVAVRTME